MKNSGRPRTKKDRHGSDDPSHQESRRNHSGKRRLHNHLAGLSPSRGYACSGRLTHDSERADPDGHRQEWHPSFVRVADDSLGAHFAGFRVIRPGGSKVMSQKGPLRDTTRVNKFCFSSRRRIEDEAEPVRNSCANPREFSDRGPRRKTQQFRPEKDRERSGNDSGNQASRHC